MNFQHKFTRSVYVCLLSENDRQVFYKIYDDAGVLLPKLEKTVKRDFYDLFEKIEGYPPVKEPLQS